MRIIKNNLLKSKQIKLEFSAQQKNFKKYHKIKYINIIRALSVKGGGVSLNILSHLNLTIKQILSILKLLKPALKKAGRLARTYLPLRVDTILTRKPKDIRMGRGKGMPSDRVFKMHAGQTFFSIYGITKSQAASMVKACALKLNLVSKINNTQW